MYLLDSCAISDFMKGEVHTLNKLKSMKPSLIYTSSISKMEVLYGLLRRFDLQHRYYKIWQEFENAITVLPFNETAAAKAASIRTMLDNSGKPIGAYDILIASIALTNNMVLVTSNEKEFNRIADLSIENWRLT